MQNKESGVNCDVLTYSCEKFWKAGGSGELLFTIAWCLMQKHGIEIIVYCGLNVS